ncbi:transglutaminase-like cysteine peptidase [Sphingomonas hankyongi]|uniref:Transglutaminase-like cysteine peptidase n=1 Tax=Sphingomonas hankyongi TaxID=2908209 RepID=A0ABT0S2J8_9SPHN|nr:transglutaminase-like cysteine peptidase [Sphingomonas hankyongi]MCL6730095.1 transglutaminase-like cysteine peptidase [Sphingomonas hankyongi]
MPYRCARMAGTAALALMVATAAESRPTTDKPIYAGPAAAPSWGPSMLGTVAVRVRADRFAASWGRALEDASRLPAMQRLIAPARSLTRPQQIAFVQRAVHANIHWISDATEWGQHDYWASAEQTLSHGAGDMEDRAIVKMQALRALGFDQRDLYITLARDRVGGPLTVLVVRYGGRYYVLDDTGGAPFLADTRRFEFQPILSFGWTGAWVHQKIGSPVAVVAASAAGAATSK